MKLKLRWAEKLGLILSAIALLTQWTIANNNSVATQYYQSSDRSGSKNFLTFTS